MPFGFKLWCDPTLSLKPIVWTGKKLPFNSLNGKFVPSPSTLASIYGRLISWPHRIMAIHDPTWALIRGYWGHHHRLVVDCPYCCRWFKGINLMVKWKNIKFFKFHSLTKLKEDPWKTHFILISWTWINFINRIYLSTFRCICSMDFMLYLSTTDVVNRINMV